MTDIPRVLGGRYEIGDLIGRGGMAQVHLGYDTRLSRTVAIKVLRADLAQDPMFLARFRREAQSAAALNHPSIVSVYDTAEEHLTSDSGKPISLPYIVMEYVKGRTVASLLSDGNPVPIGEAVEITVGVLNALEYSHHEGIIHRDIKPGNVMLTPDGKVKVMDFGIARAIADSAATMTQTNSVVGTAQYLSPEQARGEVVDARSDLYSTGCLLYELLTGQPPFSGDSAVSVAYQHVSEAPRPASQLASDIPDTLDRVVMKSLAKQRDDRYQSAAEFRTDLISAARGGGVKAPSVTSWTIPAAPVYPPTQVAHTTAPTAAYAQRTTQTSMEPVGGDDKTKKRNRTMIWVGVVFLILAIAGIVYAMMSKDNGHPDPTPSSSSTTLATVPVPDLSGMNESNVKTALKQAGLVFEKGDDVPSDTVAQGIFVKSSPSVNTPVEKGSTVNVSFSSGKEQADVPNVVGKSQDEATKLITGAGFVVGTVTPSDNPEGTPGTVTDQNPRDGKLDKGSAINITVVSEQVTIPDLSGMDQSSAEAELGKYGLTPNAQVKDDIVDPSAVADKVFQQNPSAGAIAKRGDTVTFVIPTGKVKVPNLMTLDGDAAQQALKAQRLTFGIEWVDNPDLKPGSVVGQQPLAGTLVPWDTTVTISIVKGS